MGKVFAFYIRKYERANFAITYNNLKHFSRSMQLNSSKKCQQTPFIVTLQLAHAIKISMSLTRKTSANNFFQTHVFQRLLF